MTRETKIGLLVGLAFIIVIGILLSDHLTSATEPQQAQLAQVAGNVRTGVTVPGGSTANPPITVAQPQAPVTPPQTVPLKQELTPPKPPIEIVSIGGAPTPAAAQQPQPPITIAPPSPADPANAPTANLPTAQPQPEQEIVQAPTSPPSPNSSVTSVADTMKEELITLDGRKVELTPAGPLPSRVAVTTTTQHQLPPGARQYRAESGDSVSRMAAKLMGGDTRTNRNAIIAANPSLQQNANMVIAGKSYIIPAAPAPAPAAAPVAAAVKTTTPAPLAPAPTPLSTPAPIASAPPTPMPPPAPDVIPAAPVAPEHFYIVKGGDTLTKIAVEQLGSAGGVPAIMDLNKAVLKGKDIIRPNMKLRLPAKPMASAE